MSTQANKTLVRRYWDEFWNAQAAAVADELFLPEQAAREKRFAAALHSAFPDGRATVETMVAEGDCGSLAQDAAGEFLRCGRQGDEAGGLHPAVGGIPEPGDEANQVHRERGQDVLQAGLGEPR
jgi:hypothetical protein